MLADMNRWRHVPTGGTSGQSIIGAFAGSSMATSSGAGGVLGMSSKVEAETHHLLQVESRDYLMMESLIRRRLNRDSEDNLDNSFEVLYSTLLCCVTN